MSRAQLSEACGEALFDQRVPNRVETVAINDGAVLGQAKNARPLVARLRLGRDGAYFDETKAQIE